MSFVSFPLAGTLFICLDSVSKTLFWLRCLVVCCGLSCIHLLQWPHNLTIYSPFPPIFFELPFSYLWLLALTPTVTHTQENVLIHVRTLISSSITSHRWNSSLMLQEMGEFTVHSKHHDKSFYRVYCQYSFLEKLFWRVLILNNWLKGVEVTFYISLGRQPTIEMSYCSRKQ